MKTNFLLILSICFLASCLSDSEQIDNFKETTWVSNPSRLGMIDTLQIDSNNFARYYLAELGWWCESTYLPFSDTFYLLTVTKSIDMNAENLEPNISSSFVYSKNLDSLILVKIQRKQNDSLITDLNFEPYYLIKE